MPNRIIRESILTSQPVCSLGWPEEVFYRRLMNVVDDYGRCEALPQLLRARCYPLQTDQVRVADISRWMAACQKAGLVVLYGANGKEYLQIEKFGQQQRSTSKCPAPPSDDEQLKSFDSNCEQPPASEHLGVVVSEGVSEGVGGKRAREKRRKTTLQDDFCISARVIAWAKSKGYDRLDDHLEAFKSKCRAKGYEYIDWDDAFMEAVRTDWAKLRIPEQRQSPATPVNASPSRRLS